MAKRRLASMVSVRFAPAEEAFVRQAAARRGESLSGFVRRAALREAGWTSASGGAMSWSGPPVVSGTAASTSAVRLVASS